MKLEKTIAVLDYSDGQVRFIDIAFDPEKEEIENVLFSEESGMNESDCSWVECDIGQVQKELIELTQKRENEKSSYSVFATSLLSVRYDIKADSEIEAMQKAEEMFNYDKKIFLDDSSIHGDIVSENSGIDDVICENRKKLYCDCCGSAWVEVYTDNPAVDYVCTMCRENEPERFKDVGEIEHVLDAGN